LRALPAAGWPDETFPERLAAGLAEELAPPRRLRPRVRPAVAVALAAAAAVTLVVVALNRATPVSAATVGRQAFAATTGRDLAPVSFTQVIVNTVPSGAFVPVPPPTRVVEHVLYAASDRWRVEASITEPNGEGTTTLLTVRDGDTIVTVRGSPSEGKTETRRAAGSGA